MDFPISPKHLGDAFDPVKGSGTDLQHVEGDGNLKYEPAQMFYVHIRVKKYYTYEQVNELRLSMGGSPIPTLTRTQTQPNP